MAKSTLWASTENDLGNDVAELETTPEEGEVADVQVETDAAAADAGADLDNVDAGLDAADELGEVQDLVEAAVDEGEGLTPLAAEAVALAVRVIASKLGANPSKVYQLCATENFASPSMAKANSTHALEGVQEFLKDLWTKIKTALTNGWNKVKALWAKHISNVGRMKKALESMKAKVKASSGKMDGKPYMDKAPSGLGNAFAGQGDLSAKQVQEYVAGLQDLVGVVGLASGMTIGASGSNVAAWLGKIDGLTSKGPFKVVGGDSLTIEFDKDTEEGTAKLDIKREPGEGKDSERGMVVADKATLVSLLDAALASIKVTIDAQKKSDKAATEATKFLNEVEKDVAAAGEGATPEVQKDLRKKMRMGYKISSFDAKIAQLAASENVKLCKGVLTFASACLKQYK